MPLGLCLYFLCCYSAASVPTARTEWNGRQLLEAEISDSTGFNATIVVSVGDNDSSAIPTCILNITGGDGTAAVATSPLTVLLEKGSSSFLDIAVGDESSFVNTTRISASDVRQLSNGDLKAQVDPNAGLATITYLTHVAVLHSTATILGGLFEDVSDSYPLQLNPDNPTALCTVNITFEVVKASSGSIASFISQSTGGSASSSSSSCSSSDGSGCSDSISPDAGVLSLPPLPDPLPASPSDISIATCSVDQSAAGPCSGQD